MFIVKNCPFCGGKTKVYEEYDGKWIVECMICFSRNWRQNSKQEAIDKWNRRVEDEHTD